MLCANVLKLENRGKQSSVALCVAQFSFLIYNSTKKYVIVQHDFNQDCMSIIFQKNIRWQYIRYIAR